MVKESLLRIESALEVKSCVCVCVVVTIPQGCEGFQVDVCGVCAGDGSTCELFSGTLFLSVLSVGYHKILDIPSGAQQIKIQETQKTRNYLGN